MSIENMGMSKIADEAIEKIELLATQYKKHGLSAFTAALGAFLIIFTFIIAAQTSPSDPDSSLLNISTAEEIIFLSTGLLLVTIGGINLVVNNVLIHRLDALDIQVRIESIRAGTKNLELLQQATNALTETNRLLSNTKRRRPDKG